MDELKAILRYWRMVFWETADEIGIFSAIVATGAGMTAVLLAANFGFAQKGEIPELIFITIVSAVAGVLLEFVIKFLFITPSKIHKKYESYVGELEKELRVKELVKPFEVAAICLPHPSVSTCADCFVEIRNPNQAVSDIRFKIIKIEPDMFEPPPARTHYSTKHINLGSIVFTFSDAEFESLNEDEKGRIDIFRAMRTQTGTTVVFSGDWKKAGFHNSFAGIGEYILTIGVSAVGVKLMQHSFKICFLTDQKEPVFTILKL